MYFANGGAKYSNRPLCFTTLSYSMCSATLHILGTSDCRQTSIGLLFLLESFHQIQVVCEDSFPPLNSFVLWKPQDKASINIEYTAWKPNVRRFTEAHLVWKERSFWTSHILEVEVSGRCSGDGASLRNGAPTLPRHLPFSERQSFRRTNWKAISHWKKYI